jgi:hypothetical protein
MAKRKKGKMKNNCLQNITQKQPNGLATGTQQNSRDALICSGRVSSKTAVMHSYAPEGFAVKNKNTVMLVTFKFCIDFVNNMADNCFSFCLFFFWPLYCLFLFYLRLLITHWYFQIFLRFCS